MRTPSRRSPIAVIALGGNALAPDGERSNIHDQFRHTRESLGPIVDLALDGWNLCVVHGNGRQVGDELVRNEVARAEVAPLPLGVLVANTAGWIGYMIQQSIENALQQGKLFSQAVTPTGIIVTKLDGSARGGAVTALRRELGLPIRFLGTGEELADLEAFDPVRFAEGLLD